MNARERQIAKRLEAALLEYDRKRQPLPGIREALRREALLEQLIESIHRVQYVSVMRTRTLSNRRADPSDELFDPLKAAILHQQWGDADEAFWLVFLFVHFGKHPRAGWRYVREIYGGLGGPLRWNWARISAASIEFREWLNAHQNDLTRAGVPRGFGNHRKYQSLDAYSPTGTGAAVESYVKWVGPTQKHEDRIEIARQSAGGDPRQMFDDLFKSMKSVASFGRTARFDYLTMLGKLNLAPIEPGSTYMKGATGPLGGARMLFGGDKEARLSRADLDRWLVELDTHLRVGMQVLEDALCNWQKSPSRFKPFRG